MTRRFKITIEYDGTPFVGWQAQVNGPSVQDAIEAAIFAFSREKVRLVAAGRTDAGVHALGQVAHFDLKKALTPARLQGALNAHLGLLPVKVVAAERAAKDFSARFSAKRRHYLYRIVNRTAPPALEVNRVWHVKAGLDAEAMHDAAQVLIGKHDFTTFRSTECQAKSPVKTLDRLDVARDADEILIRASARSFLHHQVRSMVGCLKLVGEGKWRKVDLKRALEKKNRAALGFNAPPQGLYLVRVDY
jgi:tRNA pseudouridine38-40 synthase